MKKFIILIFTIFLLPVSLLAASEDPLFLGRELVGILDKNTATVKLIPNKDMEAFIEYGSSKNNYTLKTKVSKGKSGLPLEIILSNLSSDREYFYKLNYRVSGSPSFVKGHEYSFKTPKENNSNFIFTVQADSHRDEKTDEDLYRKTLQNILADKPDFHIDLGDTFMSEKFAKNEADVIQRYIEERKFFDIIGNSIPIYLVNGNHEGENGWRMNKRTDNIAVWASSSRNKFYSNPLPNSFYTGNNSEEPYVGKRGGYYSWEWGDALFIVLDPFWFTKRKSKSHEDNWNYTLGKAQYDWLKNTLENSKKKYKFVFSHNIVGGSGKESRGGLEAANYFEWGGLNSDGSEGFKQNRPGWEKPIHQLMVDNGVDIFFHGHDHFYAKQDVDGIVYQLVPQPGQISRTKTNLPEMYGYKDGVFFAPAGHVRVSVFKDKVQVDYVRSSIPPKPNSNNDKPNRKKDAQIANGQISHSYIISK